MNRYCKSFCTDCEYREGGRNKKLEVHQLPKNSPRISKEFPKNSQRIPKEFPKNSKRIPKEFQKQSQKQSQRIPNFENIQFPTSHLEAENPFGLVFSWYLNEYRSIINFKNYLNKPERVFGL